MVHTRNLSKHHLNLHIQSPSVHVRTVLIQIAIFAVVLGIFASQLSGLSDIVDALKLTNLLIFSTAFSTFTLTYLAAAGAYQVLSGFKNNYSAVLKVQIASGFVNRLLPAGLGGMSLYAFFFRKSGCTLSEATALVASNSILGMIAHLGLVATVLVFNPDYLRLVQLPAFDFRVLSAVVVGVGVAAIAALHFKRFGLVQFVTTSLQAIRRDLRIERRTLIAICCNIALTSLNVLTLTICVLSVQSSISWTEALIVLSAGTLLGSVVPTPGGIGGVEAGLLAGMTVFGIPTAAGFATVLLYRGLTYWLPILPGVIAFQSIRKQYS